MDRLAALRQAINLMQMPSGIRHARTEPLAAGTELLLRVAAEDSDAMQQAAGLLGREPAFVREAAMFYIEQILMAPGVDSYRALGTAPGATTVELRRNMALLVRCLHPDVAEDDPRRIFALRVNKAWQDLKTAERRADYDRQQSGSRDPMPRELQRHRSLPGSAGSSSRRQSEREETRPRAVAVRAAGVDGGAIARARRTFRRLLGRTS
jgi:hypothetical protein